MSDRSLRRRSNYIQKHDYCQIRFEEGVPWCTQAAVVFRGVPWDLPEGDKFINPQKNFAPHQKKISCEICHLNAHLVIKSQTMQLPKQEPEGGGAGA